MFPRYQRGVLIIVREVEANESIIHQVLESYIQTNDTKWVDKILNMKLENTKCKGIILSLLLK